MPSDPNISIFKQPRKIPVKILTSLLSKLDMAGLDTDIRRHHKLHIRTDENFFPDLLPTENTFITVGKSHFFISVEKIANAKQEPCVQLNGRTIIDADMDVICQYFGALAELTAQMQEIENEYPIHRYGSDLTIFHDDLNMAISENNVAVTKDFLNLCKREGSYLSRSTLLHELGHAVHKDSYREESASEAFDDLLKSLENVFDAALHFEGESTQDYARVLMALTGQKEGFASRIIVEMDGWFKELDAHVAALVESLEESSALASADPLAIAGELLDGECVREHIEECDEGPDDNVLSFFEEYMHLMQVYLDETKNEKHNSPSAPEIILAQRLEEIKTRYEPLFRNIEHLYDMQRAINHAEEFHADMYAIERIDNPDDHIRALEAISKEQGRLDALDLSDEDLEIDAETDIETARKDRLYSIYLKANTATSETHPSWAELIEFAEDYVDALAEIKNKGGGVENGNPASRINNALSADRGR